MMLGHLCFMVMAVGSLDVLAGSCYSHPACDWIIFLLIGASREFRATPPTSLRLCFISVVTPSSPLHASSLDTWPSWPPASLSHLLDLPHGADGRLWGKIKPMALWEP